MTKRRYRGSWLSHPVAALAFALFLAIGNFAPVAMAQDSTPITPPEEEVGTSTIQVDAFTCQPGDLEEGGTRTFQDFQAACTTSTPQVEFTLHEADDNRITQATNESGRTSFSFDAGEPVRFFSGVPLEAEEYLFCSTDQGDPQEVAIDAEGVSTFDNAAAENRICSWFLVEQADTEPSTIDLTAFNCPAGTASDGNADAFASACTEPAANVAFNLSTGELTDEKSTDAQGAVAFEFPSGEQVDFYAKVPAGSDEHLFCATGTGDPTAVEIDGSGVYHFPNTDPAEITCSWYLVPAAEATATAEPTEEATATEAPTETPAPTETVAPTETTAPSEPTATDEPEEVLPDDTPAIDGGEIAVTSFTCPTEFNESTDARDFETLAANCTDPTSGVVFNFGYPGGDTDTRLTDGTFPETFGPLEAGDYTLFTDVPLEAASEFLFCTADGGNRYEKELSERGVASYNDLQSEAIDCTWFIVPISERGDETGASIEIHLAACPVGYNGNTIYEDCHDEGIADQDFTVTGPDGEQSGTTEVAPGGGPGVVLFSGLAAGDYEVKGGPPGDFGTVKFFCSTQPGNTEATYSLDGVIGSVTLAENQHVVCDWYFIPDDQGETPTPTPTQEPETSEITITLYDCEARNDGYAGASLDTFTNGCTEEVNEVPFRMSSIEFAPLTKNTGTAGEGAVHFEILVNADVDVKPTLPSGYKSVAVFCTIGDGDPYQKALSNGGTTYYDLEGEKVNCSWFMLKNPVQQPNPPTPTGSITVREMLCAESASEIKDFDKECVPGSTGTAYTLGSITSGQSFQGTPDAKGVLVFKGLPDGNYSLKQNTGGWCKAVADRVNSKSEVIVQGGGNTDVVLYQCNAVEGLPTTGAGDNVSSFFEPTRLMAIVLAVLALPLMALGVLGMRRERSTVILPAVEPARVPTRLPDGRIHMRFR